MHFANLVRRRRIHDREWVGLHIQPTFLDSVDQFLRLQPEFLRKLMDARGQRQLPGMVPRSLVRSIRLIVNVTLSLCQGDFPFAWEV
jgi:hypothetical protein